MCSKGCCIKDHLGRSWDGMKYHCSAFAVDLNEMH